VELNPNNLVCVEQVVVIEFHQFSTCKIFWDCVQVNVNTHCWHRLSMLIRFGNKGKYSEQNYAI